MSTSSKHPATIRQGGPGSSEQNAKSPLDLRKPSAIPDNKATSRVSGGGGEKDSHHTHDARSK
ncbi:hypothetical protein [Rhizobium paknamense]|uniref:Uncharacterized protein n=1 Tax=Rhizobium paknamense TaxID=1206817 RepID=A0ABU0IE25_9HYPH|nr:hypothetical protein [Rhizobium paknamense]MDQ0456490.1 hypothetical protein [Rhizobium paknamense]